ncbi:MAG TPA: ABC transporter ATP-binding protein [Tepidisphaeraceae bacterium]|jgi:ABC-2 type transport system ATP-binding protein
MSEQVVIQMRDVHKSFGKAEVLRGVEMSVPAGQTFAFLGRNGAGKSTTIRTMLGLLHADTGEIRVLGLDPKKDALEIRRRVGYVAEDQQMFGWMRVKQLISFIAPFYPMWDQKWANDLAQRFELPMNTRIKHLSKGQGVRVALLLALAHRPELVILDDPTLGLDPIMRKEFLRDLVSYLQAERTSVFFSSHLLYEIEPVADSVVILDHGRVVRQASTEELREKVKRLIAPLEYAQTLRGLAGLLDFSTSGRQATAVVDDIEAVRSSLNPSIEEIDLNLDEIFEAYVIGRKEGSHAQPDLERVA